MSTRKKTPAPRADAAAAAFSRSHGPLYKQVVAVLRDEIVKGVHAVGQHLPTEVELSERFRLSRHTVREALRELRASGLVASRQGSGTIVVAPERSTSYIHETGTIADLSQYSAPRWDIVSSEMVAVDAELAPRLHSKVGQRWLRIEAYRYGELGTAPVFWTLVYLHEDVAGIGRLVGRRERPLYEMIEDMYGERVAEVEQRVNARQVPEGLAGRLELAQGSTVIEVVRTYQLTTGKIVEVSCNLYPTAHFSLVLKLRRA
ncbi:GntR family transcriptional regulator [Pseudorhodoferax sp. Leaf267]|uniref:GntR family transcriptional regulator n=1 Tax=Pseudorhodoferax sp. Leaf267 TaxID=1736316 RepID=UPI0006F2DB3D|nr:GntR family transcriptional regulator [Pseudorhodoferax sp. Leaf267]KQP14218.1 hypothetical protein ASF43_15455 [Pseudorhodoferax sp. Leaf267]